MVPLDTFLWAFVILFGLMGALRGWSKEMLVLFSVIVALAMRLIFSEYVPFVKDLFDRPAREQFYIYSGLVILLAVAGYAGPVVSGRLARASARETLQDILLGFIIGAVNGYLIIGSIWYFLDAAGYGVLGIAQPAPNSIAAALAARYLPPLWLTDPVLLTIFAFASVFVLIVLV
ncbi:MAG: CvpA family protein [Anaerolineae bacterium]|jgi:uncharacterized membrane protein required for colicin V production